MSDITVIIPNYNGSHFLPGVLSSLKSQSYTDFDILIVDNGSTDGSVKLVEEEFPEAGIIKLPENFGFSYAVNAGIRQSLTPYILLLNNDTEADPRFVEELHEAMERHPQAFSCGAKMVQFFDREKLDDAGNYICALGWAFARGKGKDCGLYEKEEKVFAACAGAAIYRRGLFTELGFFDNEHFAYLEDVDIGYRARIYGYENWYIPKSIVYHVGSGTTGSRYNQFKTRYSSRNSVYMLYKNMPLPQILLNLPFLIPGFAVKTLYFSSKGMGREYVAGIKNGISISRSERKTPFYPRNWKNYFRIQFELWANLFRLR